MDGFLYFAIGLVGGLFSGAFGIGGGIVIVPALVAFLGFPQHKAQGTSLIALLAPVGLASLWEYHKANAIDVKAGLMIALAFIVGGYFGAKFAMTLPDLILRRSFAGFLFCISIWLFFRR